MVKIKGLTSASLPPSTLKGAVSSAASKASAAAAKFKAAGKTVAGKLKLAKAKVKATAASASETAETVGKSIKNVIPTNQVILGLAGAALTAYVLQQYTASSTTPRTITNIEKDTSGTTVYRITFSPSIRITSGDLITFTGTQTAPTLDGYDKNVMETVSDQTILYDTGVGLTTMTPGGTITVKTSALAIVGDMAAQAGQDLTDAAGSGLMGFLKSINWKIWAGLGTSVCCVIIIIIIMVTMS